MPLSREYNLFFIHIPRTAGTTIEKALNMFNYESLYNVGDVYKKYNTCPQHLPFNYIKKEINENEFNFFTIIRNPYDRLVSAYYFAINNTDSERGVKEYINLNFDDFVKTCLKINPEKRIYMFDGHLEPQFYFLENGYYINIFKYEKIEKCFDWLRAITKKDLIFDHERKTPIKKHYSEYYKNEETKNIVETFYKRDFETFNYKLLNH